MQKYKISIVSYYNTIPFVYGIENSAYILENSIIEKDYPSICANKLLNNQVDIGLVPIAILPKIKNYNLITDFCIGTLGKVRTVLLVSNAKLTNIERIFLDYQSMTSVNLAKILAQNYWKITPEWLSTTEGYEKNINNNDAAIIIGDRAFNLENNFKYIYDLAEEWKNFTNLPFVFAVWAANKKIDDNYLSELNAALNFGVQEYRKLDFDLFENLKISTSELKKYLSENINFNFDNKKHESMKKYLNYLELINNLK